MITDDFEAGKRYTVYVVCFSAILVLGPFLSHSCFMPCDVMLLHFAASLRTSCQRFNFKASAGTRMAAAVGVGGGGKSISDQNQKLPFAELA